MGEIFVGEWQKEPIVAEYVRTHGIKKVFVFGDPIGDYELVKFKEMQLYKFYYRLLQEITPDALVVMNEIMHTANRYSLDYNCLRKYCLQTPHRIIFNYYPIRHDEADFMILYDMLQNNPFLKEKQVPIVVLEHDLSQRMAATVQFNKARGVHAVDMDAEIVRSLIEQGLTEEEISKHLGIDIETILRYKQLTGIVDLFKNVEYSHSWEVGEL